MEIVVGQPANLPEGYLEVRLTGAMAGVRVQALDADRRDLGEDRAGDAEVTLRPGIGSARILVVPTSEAFFAPGARLGLEIRTGAGGGEDSPQILVAQVDVGAYRSAVLATVESVGAGWQVQAGPPQANTFAYLMVGSAEPSSTRQTPPVDERALPWVGAGRYALRRARDGSSERRASGEQWALVVDSSASMRSLFAEDELAAVIELAGGVIVEETGQLPRATCLTGTLRPRWILDGPEAPGRLAAEVLVGPRLASWSLALPAVREATERGAQLVLVVTDGAPSDLEDLRAFLHSQSQVSVSFLVASRPDLAMSEPGSVPEQVAQHAFDDAVQLPNLRAATLRLGSLGDRTRTELAGALVEERP